MAAPLFNGLGQGKKSAVVISVKFIGMAEEIGFSLIEILDLHEKGGIARRKPIVTEYGCNFSRHDGTPLLTPHYLQQTRQGGKAAVAPEDPPGDVGLPAHSPNRPYTSSSKESRSSAMKLSVAGIFSSHVKAVCPSPLSR